MRARKDRIADRFSKVDTAQSSDAHICAQYDMADHMQGRVGKSAAGASRQTARGCGRDAGVVEAAGVIINERPVIKDPNFWITMAIGFSPLLVASVILSWLVQC